MAKCILCLGSNTKFIVEEKLDNNVGGIELLQCPFVADLDKKIKSSGRIDKIIISQTSINDEIPESIISPDFSVIIILSDKALMQQYDIKFFNYKNIYIVDNSSNGGKVSISFLKEMIVANEVEDYLLYKSEDIIQQEDQPQSSIESENNEDEIVEREIEQEEKPVLFGGEQQANDGIEFEPEIEAPTREISLETEKTIVVPQKGGNVETPEDRIRHIVKLFKNGFILAFVGAHKSYSTQNCYRTAKMLSKLDLTVGVLDLDTNSYPLSYITNKILSDTKFSQNGSYIEAIQKHNLIDGATYAGTNFLITTGSPIHDSIAWTDSEVEQLQKTLLSEKLKFNITLLNIPLELFHRFSSILPNIDKIIYSLPATNEDYIYFMRKIETCPNAAREALFTHSGYISVNENYNLLGTNKRDIGAIDIFLEKNFTIMNELKYEMITKVGTYIQKNPQEEDYLSKDLIINKKEMINMILSILER